MRNSFCRVLFIIAGASPCELPEHWHSMWFEKGISQLEIGPKSIDAKGECVQRKGDRFLFNLQSYVPINIHRRLEVHAQ